jgi:hypothetical protein
MEAGAREKNPFVSVCMMRCVVPFERRIRTTDLPIPAPEGSTTKPDTRDVVVGITDDSLSPPVDCAMAGAANNAIESRKQGICCANANVLEMLMMQLTQARESQIT